MEIQNKWIRAAIPALLLHCSIGTVYCWSIFSQEIADHIGFSKSATEWADSFKDRNTIYKIIFSLSIIATALVIVTQGITNRGESTILMILVLVLLFVVNAGYGGGFSNVPTLLSDHYGMSSISAIHGITLSAWGIAGLTGNQVEKSNELINALLLQ